MDKEEKWLQEYKEKIESEVYLILSPKRSLVNLMFWNKSQWGYTDDLSTAGLFTKEEIDNIQFEEKDSIPIKLERGKKNEIGLEFCDVRRAIYLKNSNIKAVLWCESDLNGIRLADVVNDLVKEKDVIDKCKECKSHDMTQGCLMCSNCQSRNLGECEPFKYFEQNVESKSYKEIIKLSKIEKRIKENKKWADIILCYKTQLVSEEDCAREFKIKPDEFLEYINSTK